MSVHTMTAAGGQSVVLKLVNNNQNAKEITTEKDLNQSINQSINHLYLKHGIPFIKMLFQRAV